MSSTKSAEPVMDDVETESVESDDSCMKSHREDFRKYLEASGVLELMTQALAHLYTETERVDDPIQYVQDFLTTRTCQPHNQVMVLRREVRGLRNQLHEAEEMNLCLRQQLAKYKNLETAGSTSETSEEDMAQLVGKTSNLKIKTEARAPV